MHAERSKSPRKTGAETCITNLTLHSGQGKSDEAVKLIKPILEGRRRTPGPEHPLTLRLMCNLANALGNQGKRDEACKLFERVLESQRWARQI
jgi:hypothetical protein